MLLPARSRERIAASRSALAHALRARGDTASVYVHARGAESDTFLFFREGKTWCAGEADRDAPMAIAVSQFLEGLPHAVSVAVCDVDLPLFLCAAVVFRKPPAVHVPTSLVDGDQILKSIQSLGKDVVLALHREDSWALAFCRGGEPAAIYESELFETSGPALATPAPGGLPTAAAAKMSPTERVLELAVMHRDLVIDLYDEIRVPRAADAGQNADQLEGLLLAGARRPVLVVMLGDRIVFRHRIDREETLVGRGLDAQLALDNLSISRRHAVIKVFGERVVIEDAGSENGVVFHGHKTPRAELRPGESVQLGKYTLAYDVAVGAAVAAVAADAATNRQQQVSADIETVNITKRASAAIEHGGLRHRIKSAVFTIGSAPDANLRIRGMLVAGIHAVIEPDLASGGYVLRREGRARAIRVNGHVVERHVLNDGDEIVMAGESLRFVLA